MADHSLLLVLSRKCLAVHYRVHQHPWLTAGGWLPSTTAQKTTTVWVRKGPAGYQFVCEWHVGISRIFRNCREAFWGLSRTKQSDHKPGILPSIFKSVFFGRTLDNSEQPDLTRNLGRAQEPMIIWAPFLGSNHCSPHNWQPLGRCRGECFGPGLKLDLSMGPYTYLEKTALVN